MELTSFISDPCKKNFDSLQARVVRVARETVKAFLARDKDALLQSVNGAVDKSVEGIAKMLCRVAKKRDREKALSVETQHYVRRPVRDKQGAVFLSLGEQFDRYVAAWTAYHLLRVTEEPHREAAAGLLYATSLPLVDERGRTLTQEELVNELKSAGTETVIERWSSSTPDTFNDAVAMVRGRAKWSARRLRKIQTCHEDSPRDDYPPSAKPYGGHAPDHSKAGRERIRYQKEYYKTLLGTELFPLCFKAASTLPSGPQRLVASLFLGGLARRCNAGFPWNRLPGNLQQELLSKCLPRAFPTENGEPNKNVIEQYFRRPIAAEMIRLDYLGEMARIIHHEFPDDDCAETRRNLEDLLNNSFSDRANPHRAVDNAGFTFFVAVGKVTATLRVRNELRAKLPHEFRSLPPFPSQSDLAGLLDKYLCHGAPLSREVVVGLTDYLCRKAGTTAAERFEFWTTLLENLSISESAERL